MDKPVVTSRPLPGTPYREHTVSLGNVELRSQMNAFTPEEIQEAVDLYRQYGICTPRHQCSLWGGFHYFNLRKLGDGGAVIDPVSYDGLYLED